MGKKVEFYYDSTVPPGSAFPCDNAKAVEMVGQLAAKGVKEVSYHRELTKTLPRIQQSSSSGRSSGGGSSFGGGRSGGGGASRGY